MKKNLIAAAIVTASILSAASAFAADGKINFTGSITDDACTVTNSISSPLQVSLGNVSSNSFSAGNKTAAPTDFNIVLTGCPAAVTSAKVKFDGAQDSADNSLLALTQVTGVAKHVGIQLVDAKNIAVPMHAESSDYTLATGDNNLKFTARYFATSDTVEAGSANATSNFTVVYN